MIENLLAEVEAGTLDKLIVERHVIQGDEFFVARANVAGSAIRVSREGETAYQAVKRLYSRLEEAYLEPRDPMAVDWEQLARDAEGEHPRDDAETPAVQ